MFPPPPFFTNSKCYSVRVVRFLLAAAAAAAAAAAVVFVGGALTRGNTLEYNPY